jgi:hypothetical protein
MNMSPAVAEELSLDNGQKIGTTRDLEKACAERARLWDLTIRRGAQTIRTQLGG